MSSFRRSQGRTPEEKAGLAREAHDRAMAALPGIVAKSKMPGLAGNPALAGMCADKSTPSMAGAPALERVEAIVEIGGRRARITIEFLD